MPMLNGARDVLAKLLIGDTQTLFNNANAHLGVGDSNTAFNVAQTDLQAAVNKLRKAMEPTYPQRAANVLSFRALFSTAEANFTWNEFIVANAAAAGDVITRKVEALGAKTVAASWQLTVDVTVAVGA